MAAYACPRAGPGQGSYFYEDSYGGSCSLVWLLETQGSRHTHVFLDLIIQAVKQSDAHCFTLRRLDAILPKEACY